MLHLLIFCSVESKDKLIIIDGNITIIPWMLIKKRQLNLLTIKVEKDKLFRKYTFTLV